MRNLVTIGSGVWRQREIKFPTLISVDFRCRRYNTLALTCQRVIATVAYRLSIDTDLDDLERRNSLYFAFFSPKSMLVNNVTVVEDRPIMSANHCLLVPVFYL